MTWLNISSPTEVAKSSKSGRSSPGYVPFTATPELADQLKSDHDGDETDMETKAEMDEEIAVDADDDESDDESDDQPPGETSFTDDFLAVYGTGDDSPERESLGRIARTVRPPEELLERARERAQARVATGAAAAAPVEAVVPDGDEKSPGMVPFTMTPAIARGTAPRSRYVGVPNNRNARSRQSPQRNVKARWDGTQITLPGAEPKEEKSSGYIKSMDTASGSFNVTDDSGYQPVPDPPVEISNPQPSVNSPPQKGQVSLINRLFGNSTP